MPDKQRKTVLAIDDDITFLTLMRKILEKDYEVCLAKSADAAWNILNNTGVDMILLDVEMPAVSGFEFMSRLRGNSALYYYYTPVIFVTSHGTKDIIVKAKKLGAEGFVVKPVNPEILLKKIESLFTYSDTEELSTRDYILKHLHLMSLACKMGRSAQIEKISVDLRAVKYNVGTDDQIFDICHKALNFEYPSAIRKINALLKNNLYDLNKNDNWEGL